MVVSETTKFRQGGVRIIFEGFTRLRIDTGDVEINVVTGGTGEPLLLLHGYPQTHVIWHKVAPILARHFTVVAPDMRGYGDSGKPPGGDGGVNYAKRVMAADQLAVMAKLGHESFFLAGHDRGGRVAYRLTLDHPERVRRLATLDVVPTLEQFETMGKTGGFGSYHWYFLAQPAPFPETVISRDPDYFCRHMIDSICGTPGAITGDAMDAYLAAFRDPETIRATCDDYRAGYGIDCEIDLADREAGRRIECPMLAMWAALGRPHKAKGVMSTWQKWATDLRGKGIECGHFLPEEAPEETAAELITFFNG
jgi:haloacetate dehalogenase